MLYGIDVSHWEPGVRWDVVAKTHPFAMTKATDGLTGTDSLFRTYWREMKAAGVVRGAYHFFHPNVSVKDQADHYLSVMGQLEYGDMPYILDVEVTGGMSPSEVAGRSYDWLTYVQANTPGHKAPFLYSYSSFLRDNLMGKSFAKFPLWVANYGVSQPKLPKGIPDWAIWQYSDKGRVGGVPQACDVNEFRGSLTELKKLCVGAV